jgi:acyl carrier protein
MTADRDAILADLRERIARITYLEPDAIREESRYAEDLALESSGAVQLLVEIEERYGLRISDEEAVGLATVGATADLIVRKVSDARGPDVR